MTARPPHTIGPPDRPVHLIGPLRVERMWSAFTTVARMAVEAPSIVCVNLPEGQVADLGVAQAESLAHLFAAAPLLAAAVQTAPLLPSCVGLPEVEARARMNAWAAAYFEWQDGPLAAALQAIDGWRFEAPESGR